LFVGFAELTLASCWATKLKVLVDDETGAAWVTLKLLSPIRIEPIRVEDVVFAKTEYDTVAFPTPLFVARVIQDAGVETCQPQVPADVTLTVPLSAPAPWFLLNGDIVQVQGMTA